MSGIFQSPHFLSNSTFPAMLILYFVSTYSVHLCPHVFPNVTILPHPFSFLSLFIPQFPFFVWLCLPWSQHIYDLTYYCFIDLGRNFHLIRGTHYYLPSSTCVINLEVELGKLITRIDMAPVVSVEKNMIVQPHIRFFSEFTKSAFFSGYSHAHFVRDGFPEEASRACELSGRSI